MSNDRTRTDVMEDALDDDFEFTIEHPKSATANASKPTHASPEKQERTVTSVRDKIAAEKAKKLRLEKPTHQGSRATRTEMYNEMEKKAQKKFNTDVFVYASVPLRGIAFVLDMAFTVGVYVSAVFITPYILKGLDLFLNKYGLDYTLPRPLMNQSILYATIVISMFLFIVVPLAFYNRTFGKKLTGLHVRGIDSYTLSIPQALLREFLWKPISAGLVIGFIMPFFANRKQSLHDKLAKTFVIKE